MPARPGDARRLAQQLQLILKGSTMLHINEHFLGLNFERTVAQVHGALGTYIESVKASADARMKKITALIEETKSEGSDADVVVTWAQRNAQWAQAPLQPKMREMLAEATLAGAERGLVKQLTNLVAWLAVDLDRDPTRMLTLSQSDMSMFLPYDTDVLRRNLPYDFTMAQTNGLSAIGASRFGGVLGNFREVAATYAASEG